MVDLGDGVGGPKNGPPTPSPRSKNCKTIKNI